MHGTSASKVSVHVHVRQYFSLAKKVTIKYQPGNHHASHLYNVLLPSPNHLLTAGADDSSL